MVSLPSWHHWVICETPFRSVKADTKLKKKTLTLDGKLFVMWVLHQTFFLFFCLLWNHSRHCEAELVFLSALLYSHCIPLFLTPKLHQVLVQLQSGDKEQDFSLAPIQVSISVQLWRLPGCHEFLAALGETSALNKIITTYSQNVLHLFCFHWLCVKLNTRVIAHVNTGCTKVQ